MAASKPLQFFLLAICLHSLSGVATKDTGVNTTSAGKGARLKARSGFTVPVLVRRSNVGNDTIELKNVVNSVRHGLTNQTTLPYKERVEDLSYKLLGKLYDGMLYEMTMRLNETHCREENTSCDLYFDTDFLPTKKAEFVAPFKPRLGIGKEIEIEGIIPMNAKRFNITIQTGYERPMEGQLRINVIFSPNSSEIKLEYYDEAWNLRSHYKSLLAPRQRFELTIACLSKKFEININGKTFASFNHVLPYQDATHLSIYGDVIINKISGVGEPLPLGGSQPSKSWLDDDIPYQTSPYVPFVAPLAKTLAAGRSIGIKGVVPSYSKKFAITIQNGSEIETKRAQLRLTATFSKDSKNNTITLSYCDDGNWQGEQLQTPVLTSGHAFQIFITSRSDHFQILIGGEKFANYEYQLPLEQATHLSVIGIVNITEVVGISQLPRVAFLDKPMPTPYTVSFKNVSMVPGRKLKLWLYANSGFAVRLSDAKSETHQFSIELYPDESKISMNSFMNGKWGTSTKISAVSWAKLHPVQMEIHCLEKKFKVIFYGMWSYDSFEYRMPLKGIALLSISSKDAVVYAVDGTDAVPPTPPSPPPPPQSRVCSMQVWYRKKEVWLHDVNCTNNSS